MSDELAVREAEAAQRELDADPWLRAERATADARLRSYAATAPREVAPDTDAQAADAVAFAASLPVGLYDVPLVRREPSQPWRVDRGEGLTLDQRRAYRRYRTSLCVRPRVAARSSRAGRPRARGRRERACCTGSTERGKPRRSRGGDEPPGEPSRPDTRLDIPRTSAAAHYALREMERLS
jgi:hypothetical protein